jgi:uncharacterized protein YkwD
MHARLARRTGAAVVMVLLVIGMFVSSFAGVANAQVTRRERFLQLTNEVRIEHDRQRLAMVRRLSHYAHHHSQEMADRGYLFHSDGSVLQQMLAPYHWSIGGENVGVGGNVDTLQAAFMASKEHRDNILRSSFDHVAIGCVRQDGSLWVTVIFYG